MKKKDKIWWFKMNAAVAGAINRVNDNKAGKALKLALSYLDTQDEAIEENITDESIRIIFGIFKEAIDEAIRNYQDSVENGKRGAEIKRQQALLEKHGSDESTPNRSNLEDEDPLRPP